MKLIPNILLDIRRLATNKILFFTTCYHTDVPE